uniref:Uncharacterized protein n=1 Tax=Pan troglodytes TaxID=9598 RepID=A0A2I3S9G4_PANTR
MLPFCQERLFWGPGWDWAPETKTPCLTQPGPSWSLLGVLWLGPRQAPVPCQAWCPPGPPARASLPPAS